MKLKYILSSLFAAAAIFAACSTEEPVSKMTGLEVSNDYITLGSEENLSRRSPSPVTKTGHCPILLVIKKKGLTKKSRD